ncbi:hypothetical protein CRYUN_Cryun08bG0097700 [Craigia yunnanensis]
MNHYHIYEAIGRDKYSGFRLQLHRFQDFDDSDSKALDELFHRAYNHSLWVLNKYSVDESTARKLKEICSDG